jgi:phosphocarrier protein
MKRITVRVRWAQGLHLRPAAQLVRLAQQFRATIWLRSGRRQANLRSVLSLIGLCALMGSTLDVEAAGDDEDNAVQAVQRFFQSSDDDGPADEGGPPAINPRDRRDYDH